MKILVLTNLYPPFFIGGYELGCRDVVSGLKSKSHDVKVITSKYGVKTRTVDEDVERVLNLYDDTGGLFQALISPIKENENRREWSRVLDEYKPDIVYFWNLARISISAINEAVSRGLPCAWYVSDPGAQIAPDVGYITRYCRRPQTVLGQIRWGIGNVVLSLIRLKSKWPVDPFPELHFTSDFMRQQFFIVSGFSVKNSYIIHWGAGPEFRNETFSEKQRTLTQPLEILYAGRVVAEKGVVTVVKAVILFLKNNPDAQLIFRIAGTGDDQVIASLHEMIRQSSAESKIRLEGMLSREHLIKLYRKAEIFVLPSEWDEPFAIAPLEAMSCGCCVIATRTGGSAEIFNHNVNSMVFEAGNVTDLESCLTKLYFDADLRMRLSKKSFEEAHSTYTMDIMIQSIEERLQSLINHVKNNPA